MQKQEASDLANSKLKTELKESQEMYQVTYEKLVRMESSNQQPNDKRLGISDSGAVPAQVTSFTHPSVDVSAYESKIERLTRTNSQLTDSNDEFKGEVKSLNRKLADLEQRGSEAVTGQASALVTNVVPAVDDVVSPPVVEGKGGWGTLGWLIPFLVIGLGVAFFVILKEEFQRPLAGKNERKRDN